MSAYVVIRCGGLHQRKKGVRKTPVDRVELRPDHGIIGDAHAGNWHRQVSLLAMSSVRKMQKLVLDVDKGDFAENPPRKGLTWSLCRSELSSVSERHSSK